MPMNRPTAAELTEAIREYLEQKVQPELTGALAYENRVAINLLKILERQLQNAESLQRQEQERLRTLLHHDGDVADLNAELCAGIGRGDFDARHGELFDHLFRSTLGKLAIDSPRYAAYQRVLKRIALASEVATIA